MLVWWRGRWRAVTWEVTMPKSAQPRPPSTLVAMVYRCCGKHTYGVDHLTKVGPFPTECPRCGTPWTGTEVHAED